MGLFKTSRMSDSTLISSVDNDVNDLEAALVNVFGLETGNDVAPVTTIPASGTVTVKRSLQMADGATLALAADPANALEAATKQYVDNAAPSGGPFLPLAGGTMTGSITLPGNPTAPFEAATKNYVDSVAPAPFTGANVSVDQTGPTTVPAASSSAPGYVIPNLLVSDFATQGFYSSSNPDRLTIPTSMGGIYVLAASITGNIPTGSSLSGTVLALDILVNGGTKTVAHFPIPTVKYADLYRFSFALCSGAVMLNDGDYVQMSVQNYSDAGTAVIDGGKLIIWEVG